MGRFQLEPAVRVDEGRLQLDRRRLIAGRVLTLVVPILGSLLVLPGWCTAAIVMNVAPRLVGAGRQFVAAGGRPPT